MAEIAIGVNILSRLGRTTFHRRLTIEGSMRLRERLEFGATILLTLCALLVTGLFVRRELSSPPDPGAPRYVEGWEEYAVGDKTIGLRNATAQIVVFSDFECPFCRKMATILDSLTAGYPSQVQVVFRHFPLTSIHPSALPAAIAAECAAEQGQFQQYHDGLFARQDSLSTTSWEATALTAGVPNLEAFRECLASPRAGQRVAADTLAGQKLGVTGTPTIMVNGWLFAGTPSLEQLEPILSGLGLSRARSVSLSSTHTKERTPIQ
jgi:protein-disulfide isomerase